MSPIQQMLLGAGSAVASKTYVDDVFSTFLYEGTSSSHTINNGIDLSGEGGLAWFKSRSYTYGHYLIDTVRGKTKRVLSSWIGEESTSTDTITSFNNNGFTLGTSDQANDDGIDFTSWTFRKTPGFFDIVTYTGTSSARTISHSLGSVPGCIMVKCRSAGFPWRVYHRGVDATSPEDYGLRLEATDAREDESSFWNDTAPTSEVFSLGGHASVNATSHSYVAYVFAGGEDQTTATARSVTFPNTASIAPLEASTSYPRTGYDFGTGDFTIECWAKILDSSTNILVDKRTSSAANALVLYTNNYVVKFNQGGSDRITSSTISQGQWYHIALVRSSGTTKMFVNGILQGSHSDTYDYDSTAFQIGGEDNGANCLNGSISNLRVVKGTAVYTSSFRPPTEPLTNITNTVLLCCNNSSITGTTVGNIQEGSSGAGAAASTDSPFDDPAAFTFGENGDQGIIKTGSYVGNGSSTGPEIFLGWEPSWLLMKNATGSNREWKILDAMRGLPVGTGDATLVANASEAETANHNVIDLTSTGFKITDNNAHYNENGETIIYCAIRRPDGYVGKPPELGTDVFAMDTGASSSTIPNFDSGFPVDFALERNVQGQSWHTMARLIQGKYLLTDSSNAEASLNSATFDSNVGFSKNGESSAHQAWMWKRHAGFDVVCYPGQEFQGRQLPHSLNAVPEMILVKNRTNVSENWAVYHKGLNGGTNPEQYYLRLNTSDAEIDNTFWYDTAPTSTHFSVGFTHPQTNQDDKDYLAMLFASVDGISKVGSYTGNGTSSSSTQTISTGFAPRFLITKNIDTNGSWNVLDTTRGWGSGNDKRIRLNMDAAQVDDDMGAPTSTGFTLKGDFTDTNVNGDKFIYYAHA